MTWMWPHHYVFDQRRDICTYVKEVKGSLGASTFNKGNEVEDVNNNNHDGRGMVAYEYIYIYIYGKQTQRDNSMGSVNNKP